MSDRDLIVVEAGSSIQTEFGKMKVERNTVARIQDTEFGVSVRLADGREGTLYKKDGTPAKDDRPWDIW